MSNLAKLSIKIKEWARTYTGVLELRHMPLGSKAGQALHSVALSQELDPAGTASDFMNIAEGDCDGIGNGTQRYIVVVVQDGRDVTRHPFMIAGADPSEGLESEPASRDGLLAQLMRHNEATSRTMMASMHEIMRSMDRTIKSLADENESLRGKRLESLEAVEDLLSQRHARELATAESQAAIESKQELVKELKLLAPAVLKRLSGKEVVPTTDPMRLMIVRALKSIGPERLQKMMAAGDLTPQETIAFGEIFQAINSEQE